MAKRSDEDTPTEVPSGTKAIGKKPFKDAATEFARFQCAKCGTKGTNVLAAAGVCEACYGG